MNESNVRVAISGVTGRMGYQLIKSLLSSKFNLHRSVVLSGAVSKCNSKFIGYDIGKVINDDKLVGITINDSIESIHKDFDVLIDFSHSQGTLKYLEVCKIYKKNMVIGTTGFTKKELSIIQSASNHIGIVLSPNFSVMVNIMLKLLKKSANILGNSVDIGILEMHHRYKNDIPSGTALRMRESIISGLSSIMARDKNKRDRFFLGKRVEDNIKINSMRVGGSIGEHSAFFVDMFERLEITHRSFDRKIFADGAIRAAAWLGKIKIGLFDMIDVLDIGNF